MAMTVVGAMFDRDEVLERLLPDEDERERVARAAEVLLEETRQMADGRYEPMLVGSVAKGTYLRDPDIDIFLMFPEETPREELERVGLEVGRAILGGETRYAEHPYTHGEYMGFEADIVPCYRIGDTSRLRSNVDRTPFHTAFIREHLPADLRDDVILLKGFARGIGTYGAEIRVEGFSGYLCELLVLHHGGFETALEASSSWTRRPIHIVEPPGGIEAWETVHLQEGDLRFRRPLNVVDPVDPARNVSSAVAADRLSTFLVAAREYLESPDLRFFFPNPVGIPTADEAAEWVRDRGTTVAVVVLDRPDLIDDILYSQVKKAHGTLCRALAGAGFEVIASAYFVDGKIDLAFEVHPAELPSIMLRRGPSVTNPHTRRFRQKWGSSVTVDGDRLRAEVPRRERRPEEVLRRALGDRSIGKDLSALASGACVLTGADATARSGVMALLMDRRFPWDR